ncbi:MAG: hypothetical protein KDA20_03120 [Phycisphaerales bacterium]|nr:hypothetical protein [Phycisphaerales bacterium]
MCHAIRQFVFATAVLLTFAPRALPQQAPAFDYFNGLRFERSIPTPQQHLGYAIGEHFTRHADAISYCKTLADASDRITIQQYGRTYARRPLIALTITSPANHARLNDILARNLELTDPRNTSEAHANEIARDNPAIIWLSYNVHGNEASSTETALQLAYTLAAATNDQITRILDDLVIVIDPCVNPDGRERYVNFYDDVVGQQLNPNDDTAEHDEPWPGGRANHYLFDLNRDWTWCSQIESQSRLPLFRTYKPQLHIDYHEQGHDSPYFLGPGEAPYNANIPDETKQWLDLYGRANGQVFDANGLVFSTRERFDYLYPGYGKVTPIYHGAISLLCEQAGHGMAGLAITVDDEHGPGLILTLQDRARNHFLTSMSYLETTASNREKQLQRFARFYRESMTLPDRATTAYIFPESNDPGMLGELRRVCDMHGIEIEQLTQPTDLPSAKRYWPPFASEMPAHIEAGAWVIRAAQPMGRLARTILERDTFVEDRDTYDITSWSLPSMLGLDGVEYAGDLGVLSLQPLALRAAPVRSALPLPNNTAGLLVPADQTNFPQALGLATSHNLFARLTGDAMTIEAPDGEHRVPMGSLLIHPARNIFATDPIATPRLDSFVQEVEALGLHVLPVTNSIPRTGPAFGNNANRRFIAPKIALLRGSPLSSLSFGHTWHMLDIQQPVPHNVINIDALRRLRLDDYNVIVLPSGSAARIKRELGDDTATALRDWVRSGGTLVAIAGSCNFAWESLIAGKDTKTSDDKPDPEPKLNTLTYAEREARDVDERIPGAVLGATIDLTNPIAAGLREQVALHMFDAEPLDMQDNAYVIARFDLAPRLGGSINNKNTDKLASTAAVTLHRVGGGNVICFASDPTNRAMNKAGMRLLLNCITIAPSMAPALQPLGDQANDHNDLDVH